MPQWIKFQLIERPYYDRNGNILTSIEGRRNRKGIDEFTGGGKVYPDIIESGKIKEWHEKDGILLINADILESGAIAVTVEDKTKTYKASPKVNREYNSKNFKAKVLTDSEAGDLKQNFFEVARITINEAGVTIAI